MGIGVGSGFLASRPTRPSLRVRQEIVALNRKAYHSTVRDVSTLEWLENLGVKGVHLAGDPATFLFSSRLQTEGKGYVALVMPPRRYCPVGTRGRLDYRRWIMTNGLAFTARAISRRGYEVRILCNDHRDEGLARWLIPTLPSGDCVLPATPEEYFRCLSESRAVVAGRLHSAILSYSMGIPFVLIDVDMRTRGFVRTYDLEAWAPRPHFLGFRARLTNRVLELVEGGHRQEWQALIRRRDEMEGRAMTLLMHAVEGTLQRGG
jgi:polysaccharide pyruvyl transferase WcaK-like protein